VGKVSRDRAFTNRENAIAAASKLIRAKGVDGVGVRELMAAAGMTQGALSGQFGTKDALVGQACAHAFEDAERALSAVASGDAAGRAQRIFEYYVSPKSDDFSCPMTTLAIDASRAAPGSPLRAAFAEGLQKLARVVAGDEKSPDGLVLLAAMVGSAILSKAAADDEFSSVLQDAIIHHLVKE
jgi:TetR/AcrR family transcriptional regulator, transcriptional repressor for nem operon